jgi:hypothetical protein
VGTDLLEEVQALAGVGVRLVVYNVPPSRRVQDALDLVEYLRVRVAPKLSPALARA